MVIIKIEHSNKFLTLTNKRNMIHSNFKNITKIQKFDTINVLFHMGYSFKVYKMGWRKKKNKKGYLFVLKISKSKGYLTILRVTILLLISVRHYVPHYTIPS